MVTTSPSEAPRKTKHLQQLHGIMRGEVEPPPIAKLIGFEIVAAEVGRAVFELRVERRHHNPMGTLHGGVICDLADIAIGSAMASTLEDDETFTTLDLSVKFLKPIWNERIRATAAMVKRTRALGVLECEVTNEAGKLVARVYSTCMVLRGDDAKGR